MKLILLFLFFISTAYAGQEWNCSNTTNTGTFIKSNDCPITGGHVEVTNTLPIISNVLVTST